MFGNVVYFNILQNYGANPTDLQLANLAASTINAGGTTYRIDWTGVALNQHMLQIFAQTLAQNAPASMGYAAPTANVQMVGLPQWGTDYLEANTGYVRE